MNELPPEYWTDEQSRQLQPRWLLLLMIAAAFLAGGFLAHGRWHTHLQTLAITVIVGIILVVSSLGYVLAEKRRIAGVRQKIEAFKRDIALEAEKGKRYRLLFESSPDAILTLNAEGLIASLNPAAEELFGKARHDLLLVFLGDVVHADDRAKVSAQLKAAHGPIKPFTIETRVPGTSAQPVSLEFLSSPDVKDGRVTAMIAIGRDVTRRRKSESAHDALQVQLRRAQKMEALGRLAGGITPDFHNFLTVILVNCQMARMDLVHGHPAIQSLEQINEASQRAAGMVRQILSFTRNQSDEQQVLDLEPIVRD